MSFEPLFLSARVITAVYRIMSTALLIAYIVRTKPDGRELRRARRRGERSVGDGGYP